MAKTARTAIRLGSVSEKVYADMLKEMDTGALPPHSRLPTEQDLCERFSVSRTAVRRALKRLSEEGRIESRQGSGSYVRDLPVDRKRSNTISVMFLGSAERLTILQDAALRRGYVIALYSQHRSGWAPESEALFLEQVKQQRHKALVAFCSPLEPHNGKLLSELARAGTTVVHVEYFRRTPPEENYVLLDYRRGAHTAAVNLMLAGYERVILATMKGSGPFCRLHEQGLLDALAEHRGGDGKLIEYSRDPDRGNVYDIPRAEDGQGVAGELDAFVGSLPKNTGVICSAPGWAEWIMAALERRKVRVPRDVGLIAIETAGDIGEKHAEIDYIGFGDASLYEMAIEEVCKPDFNGVKRLVPPRVVRCGTVRCE